jgi:alpha/beta superfamily hydrolase
MNFSKYIHVVISNLIVATAYAQPPINRYTSALFTSVTETQNIVFSNNVPKAKAGGGIYESLTGYPLNVKEYDTQNVNLSMNIFQPTGDTLSKRPVIIIAFGGGFVNGSKDHPSMRLLAQDLAKRGFVTALIDYRLGMNIFDDSLAMRAVYRGVQDGRSAVRFFKASAAGVNTYRIDSSNIFIGGHSSGAFIGIHNAYLNKESKRPLSTYAWTQSCGFFGNSICNCPDLQCLDCVGNNKTYTGNAKAVFSLAGAIGALDFMETANDPKIVMFHSSDDATVPIDSGRPFSDLSWAVVGFDVPKVYGSGTMNTKAASVGVTKQYYSYTNRGHSVHELTATTLQTDIVPNISNFFFSEVLKPVPHTITGSSLVCASSATKTYSAILNNARYYSWTVEGGTILNLNPLSPNVTVQWTANAPVKSLTLIPYSELDAKGDAVVINVNVQNSFTNTWIVNGGSWSSMSSWSLNALPESCHDVVLPSKPSPTIITIPANTIAIVKSFTNGNNMTLNLLTNSKLTVLE